MPKPDGTFHFCTDCRQINQLSSGNSFTLPRMEDYVDRIGNAKHVTKLDFLKGYWQVPLSDRASEISAFATPDCFLHYPVMSFGLGNAPAHLPKVNESGSG